MVPLNVAVVPVIAPVKTFEPVVANRAMFVVDITSTCTLPDTVPLGKFAIVCADPDTTPDGRFAIVCAELDTIPDGN